ncbi:MAG: YceI family protein [Bacteroidota bacterium]
MKKANIVFLSFFILVCSNILYGQHYQLVENASSVKISVRNAGMEIEGKLTGLDGEIFFNQADLKSSSFSVSVDANTINTGIDVRDKNLRGDEYLDTKKFPRISFVSKQIIAGNKPNTYSVKGTITIKGISKDIMFPFTAVAKNDGLLFTGEFKVYRLDFKIGVGSLVISDNMIVSLSVFTKKS